MPENEANQIISKIKEIYRNITGKEIEAHFCWSMEDILNIEQDGSIVIVDNIPLIDTFYNTIRANLPSEGDIFVWDEITPLQELLTNLRQKENFFLFLLLNS